MDAFVLRPVVQRFGNVCRVTYAALNFVTAGVSEGAPRRHMEFRMYRLEKHLFKHLFRDYLPFSACSQLQHCDLCPHAACSESCGRGEFSTLFSLQYVLGCSLALSVELCTFCFCSLNYVLCFLQIELCIFCFCSLNDVLCFCSLNYVLFVQFLCTFIFAVLLR